MNKKDLKFDIEDLKNNLLVYDRPPKESEGQFNSIWLDKVNNRLYVKDKKEGWKEIPLGIPLDRELFVSDSPPTSEDGEDGDIWVEY